MCSIIILLAESRLANYIFKYRNTTRAKLRLSYAIEFIIIHNLSYFFSFRLPFSRCGCCSLHPSFSFFKLHIFSSSSTVFVALTMATNRDHFQACFTLFPLLNDPSVPMRLMMMMMRARTANARDVVVHAVRASTSESRARWVESTEEWNCARHLESFNYNYLKCDIIEAAKSFPWLFSPIDLSSPNRDTMSVNVRWEVIIINLVSLALRRAENLTMRKLYCPLWHRWWLIYWLRNQIKSFNWI